ncbi:MAG TPA: hypothetical protein VGB37_14515 [Candidatus Lokiarchaeia archaeon]
MKLNFKDFFILVIILITLIIGISSSNKDYTPSIIPSSEQDIINNCNNIFDIEQKSLCWRDNIQTFYNYTEIDGIYNFNELKTYGGDCSEWSSLYQRLANIDKIQNEIIVEKSLDNWTTRHIFLIIYNNETECKLNQLEVQCYPKN